MIAGSDQEKIETPERVDLTVDLAGVGSRGLACLLDTFILLVVILAIALVGTIAARALGALAVVLTLFAVFLVYWFYFAFFEATRHGQTPGKRALGLRVQKVGGYPIGWSEALIRNFLRILDGLLAYAIGVVVMLITRRHQRIGDLAAGTVVVREVRGGVAELERIGYDAAEHPEHVRAGGLDLTVEEFETLHDFLARRGQIHFEARDRVEAGVAAALRHRLRVRGCLPRSLADLGDETFLLHLDAAFRGEPVTLGPPAGDNGEESPDPGAEPGAASLPRPAD